MEPVYIGTDDLYFYGLDVTTGTTLWSKQILTNGASATVSDGIVYIGGGGTHNFYAFDAVSGAEKWRFPIQNGLMTSSPLVVDELGAPHHPGDSGVQILKLIPAHAHSSAASTNAFHKCNAKELRTIFVEILIPKVSEHFM